MSCDSHDAVIMRRAPDKLNEMQCSTILKVINCYAYLTVGTFVKTNNSSLLDFDFITYFYYCALISKVHKIL